MSGVSAGVGFVWVRDGAVSIQGSVGGGDAPSGAQLVVRRPGDGAEVRFPAVIDGAQFEARVDPRELSPGDGDWHVYLDTGDLVRLGKRREGVHDMAAATGFPAVRVGDRRIEPGFTSAGDLTLASRAAGGAPSDEQTKPAPPRPRPGRRSLLAHRAALALARPFLRTRTTAAAGPHRVTILLMYAAGTGGVVRSVFNLASLLSAAHDVEIVSIVRGERKPFFDPPDGVRVSAVEDRRAGAVKGRPALLLRRVLRRFRGRLLHPGDHAAADTSLWTDLLLVRRLRRIRSGIVITTRPGLNMVGAQLSRPGVAAVGQEHLNLKVRRPALLPDIRRTYGGLDALAVLTESDRRHYEADLKPPTRVVAIPNPARGPSATRSDVSQPVVLSAGRLTRQKGFDRLIPAFAAAAREEPGWELRICGGGPLQGALRQLVIEEEASNSVLLLGNVRDMAWQMEHASLFALASRWEGLPMVLIEAMTNGLPVVSFDCPTGPADIIDDGVNGFLVPEGDVDGLREAMLELIRDEPKRRRFGAAAAERAEQYTPDVVAQAWEQLFADVAAGRAPADR